MTKINELKDEHKPHKFVDYGRSEWSLYDMDGADSAASSLTSSFNSGIEKAFVSMSKGMPPFLAINEFKQEMEKELNNYDSLGACDGESEDVILFSINEIFGKELPTIGNLNDGASKLNF